MAKWVRVPEAGVRIINPPPHPLKTPRVLNDRKKATLKNGNLM